MTRQRFRHIRRGDELFLMTTKRLRGIVTSTTDGVIVKWDNGNRVRYGEACAHLLEPAATAIEITCR